MAMDSPRRWLSACVVLAAALCWECSGNNDWQTGGDGTGGPSRPDGDGEGPGDPSALPGEVTSSIWIANSLEGTVSRLDTETGEELGRYYTSPQEGAGDPSRTSVNLHGDAVVANRDPAFGPSSVTKIAAREAECVDRNGNGVIDTSRGAEEVLPWGEDECMLWNTPIESVLDVLNYHAEELEGRALGLRATAWDGLEDPETGRGGSVWVGAMYTGEIFQLDGETGAILGQAYWSWAPHTPPPVGPPVEPGMGTYGGAMDGRGNLWLFDGEEQLGRLNMTTLEVDTFAVPCGYGIAVDARGRVWTSGGGCVNRLDPDTGESTTFRRPECDAAWESACDWEGTGECDWPSLGGCFFRGLAVDNEGSVWVADTLGTLLRFDEESVELGEEIALGVTDVVGVAVDYHGMVWAISAGEDSALRVDPDSHEVDRFPVGSGPYTYSDMTGFQLSTVTLY